jgi:undecaprenyl phosphate N,N'-diacetylbacillosamine 1-phosphate transferase
VRSSEIGLKRLLDAVVSAVALVVLTPLLLVVSLLVRITSSGPVLFRQGRLGRRGVPFTIYKFRTMVPDSPDIRNDDGSAFSGENDPRVTRVGRVLRKTSFDELPQLLNVLKGDMSLVGPRPDQVDQIQYYTAEEAEKLSVKPGITGLAQIKGRNGIPWQQRKRLDVEYVRQQSLWLDLRILILTIPCVLARRNIFIGPSKTDSLR